MAYDQATYEALRRQALASYSQRSAMNAYNRYLAETRGQRPILQLEEAAFGARKEVPRLTSSYGKRGLQGQGVKSGVYSKALSDYAVNRARQLGYAREDLAGTLRGYDLTGAGYQSEYEDTLADIERRKAADIAADAAALQNLQEKIMAVIRYGGGSSAPRTAGRGIAPAVRPQPMRATPAFSTKPMGQSDIDAGSAAAGGFNFSLDFGGGGGGGTSAAGQSAAINTRYKLAVDKATAERNRKQAEYIRGLLSGTGYRSAIDELLGKVGEEETRQLGALDTQFNPAIEKVKTAYTTGTTQATAGYDALKTWLQNNAPRAYATATRATPVSVDNALAAYQRAQGASTAPADAAVQMMNTAAQGGAGNYNALLNTLAAASQAAQESRLAEEGMARLATGNALSAGQTSALAAIAAQRAAAESGIRSQFGQTRLSAEQAAIQRRQGLEDALRALVGY